MCLQLNSHLKDTLNNCVDVRLVESEICPASELVVEKFPAYFENMVEKYPDSQTVLSHFLSTHFKRKFNAADTSSEWMASASLYKAYLLDTFLKSKNKKAVLRTHLFLGTFFYETNVSDTAWRMLQRLRIVPTRDTVEKYLKNLPSPQPKPKNFLFLEINNLDIYLHKASSIQTTNLRCCTSFRA